MSDITTLQYLVDLVDDETEEVRKQIIKELINYGTNLEQDLHEFSDELTEAKLSILEPVLQENRRQWLYENWNLWQRIDDEYESLEKGMELLSAFQDGLTDESELSILLDSLSEEFMNKFPFGDEFDLANFLFREKNITGAKQDYYNPRNSNLIYTIKHKQGLPITLTVLYMLIGARAGLFIEGCNFPGHFLAKIKMDEEVILVDCFNQGRLIYETELQKMVKESYEAVMKIITAHTNPPSIIRRMLNNLANAYKQKGDQVNSDFFSGLIKVTTW
ncbi:MAG: transglutaminase-like domain-containing protein [Melioribacteraceae bacterium]|nr:MAG: transglutaminase-like domain-containing protein [Melioribacteraceae bacterium]